MSDYSFNLWSKEILQQVLDRVSDGVVVYGPDARVLLVNQKVCDFLGIEASEYTGKGPEDHMKAGFIKNSIVAKTIQSGRETFGIITTKDGDVMSRCQPVHDADGQVKLIVATACSMSELNDLHMKLEQERYESSKYRREIEHLRQVLLVNDDFVCESVDMKYLMETVKKVAPIDCNVLITGESGVGKEVAAKTIHNNSPCKDGPFIPVNIAAIPEPLLESELFGYEEGAFTGAARGGKIGLFEVAQGGTLFLDEIGDMPYPTQVKILRAIECGEIIRVGGKQTIPLNIRIISATNKDLPAAIKNGSFREDLYYRLSVVPLYIKPLRERKEDIAPLCAYFLDRFNQKHQVHKALSIQALELLEDYPWPGNIRELKNIIERLAILASSNMIMEYDVHRALYHKRLHTEKKEDPSPDLSLWESYERTEREKIMEALQKFSGNKSKAAEYLGISRSRLYRKLKQ